ncbi:MAG TPA: hypothetical protein PKY59_18665 [Pyrinomonadaceae bacterium]|nr:hypothetical protein [Pyrinomonadaceae bacterium]
MNFWLKKTKIFATLILLFASFNLTKAQDSIYKLQAGTKIRLKMETEINSKVSSENDTFLTKVSEPVKVRDSLVLPADTIIEGRVVKVEKASAGGRGGKMEIVFESIRFPNGEKRAIEGVLVKDLKAESSQSFSLLSVLGGTAVGAIIGAVSKTDNGAIIGAGIGAGAGTGVAFARKGKDVRIKTDEEFEIELKKEVILPVQDY